MTEPTEAQLNLLSDSAYDYAQQAQIAREQARRTAMPLVAEIERLKASVENYARELNRATDAKCAFERAADDARRGDEMVACFGEIAQALGLAGTSSPGAIAIIVKQRLIAWLQESRELVTLKAELAALREVPTLMSPAEMHKLWLGYESDDVEPCEALAAEVTRRILAGLVSEKAVTAMIAEWEREYPEDQDAAFRNCVRVGAAAISLDAPKAPEPAPSSEPALPRVLTDRELANLWGWHNPSWEKKEPEELINLAGLRRVSDATLRALGLNREAGLSGDELEEINSDGRHSAMRDEDRIHKGFQAVAFAAQANLVARLRSHESLLAAKTTHEQKEPTHTKYARMVEAFDAALKHIGANVEPDQKRIADDFKDTIWYQEICKLQDAVNARRNDGILCTADAMAWARKLVEGANVEPDARDKQIPEHVAVEKMCDAHGLGQETGYADGYAEGKRDLAAALQTPEAIEAGARASWKTNKIGKPWDTLAHETRAELSGKWGVAITAMLARLESTAGLTPQERPLINTPSDAELRATAQRYGLDLDKLVADAAVNIERLKAAPPQEPPAFKPAPWHGRSEYLTTSTEKCILECRERIEALERKIEK